jgi:hypothetical protein
MYKIINKEKIKQNKTPYFLISVMYREDSLINEYTINISNDKDLIYLLSKIESLKKSLIKTYPKLKEVGNNDIEFSSCIKCIEILNTKSFKKETLNFPFRIKKHINIMRDEEEFLVLNSKTLSNKKKIEEGYRKDIKSAFNDSVFLIKNKKIRTIFSYDKKEIENQSKIVEKALKKHKNKVDKLIIEKESKTEYYYREEVIQEAMDFDFLSIIYVDEEKQKYKVNIKKISEMIKEF